MEPVGEPQVCYAVVHSVRRGRKRVPAGCVEIVADAAAARARSGAGRGHRAARLLGPSRSSEGQHIYYLLEWLD